VFIESVKDVEKLKLRLIEAWSGIHPSIVDQAIDQWRVCLNAKHFELML